jgi:hypothetical protein
LAESTLPITDHAAAASGGLRRRALVWAHLLLLAVALAPVFLVEVPALVDYPNHLARMHILASLGGSPDLQAIYAANWSVLPNLAMDAIVPWLGKVVGIAMAGKLFVALTLVLLVAGTLALGRAIHGEIGAGTLAVYLVLYNYVFSLGFLNYLFGVGLGLLLLALWIGLRERAPWRRVALATGGAIALFFCHLGAVATYALCVAGYELWDWGRSRPLRLSSLVRRALLAGAPLVPAAALFLLFSPTPTAETGVVYLFWQKTIAPLVPTLFYTEAADYYLMGGLVLLFLLALACRVLSVAGAVALPVLGLAAAVVLVPTWIFGNWGNDFRLVVPLVLVLIAGIRIKPGRPRTAALVGLAALALFIVRIGTLAGDWLAYDRLYGELRAAARTLEPGARVLPAVEDWDRVAAVAPNDYRRPFYHAPALMLLERPVFLPTLFTAAGRQPLAVQPAYAALDVPHAKPMPVDLLVSSVAPESAERLAREAGQGEFYDRFAGWPQTFDYVLMLDFGTPRNPLPGLLEPKAAGSYFTLYAISSD